MRNFNLPQFTEWLTGTVSVAAIISVVIISLSALALNDISLLQGY